MNSNVNVSTVEAVAAAPNNNNDIISNSKIIKCDHDNIIEIHQNREYLGFYCSLCKSPLNDFKGCRTIDHNYIQIANSEFAKCSKCKVVKKMAEIEIERKETERFVSRTETFEINGITFYKTSSAYINAKKAAESIGAPFIESESNLGPQETAFQNRGTNKIMIKYGNYSFANLPDHEAYLEFVSNVPINDRHFYEVAIRNEAQRLFADIDGEFATLNDAKEEDFIEGFVNVLGKCFEECKLGKFDLNKCRWLTSSSPTKLSVHFIYNDSQCFKNSVEQKKFWDYVAAEFEKNDTFCFIFERVDKSYENRSILDTSVYSENRAFRIIGNTKENSDRVLKAFKWDHTAKRIVNRQVGDDLEYFVHQPEAKDYYNAEIPEYTPVKKTIRKQSDIIALINKYMPNTQLIGVKGRMFKLKTVGTRICVIGGESNDSDGCFAIWKSDGLYAGCHDSGCAGKTKKLEHFESEKKVNSKGFDRNDPFCWIDFEMKYSKTVFNDYETMWNNIKTDLPRVFARTTVGTGVFIKKDNVKDKIFNMIESIGKNLDFKIHYKIIEEEKKEKRVTVADIKLSKMIFEYRTEFPVFSDIVCKPNAKDAASHEFNIWQGFKAKEVDKVDEQLIQPILNMLYEIWADKKEELYFYFLKWFSFLICHPSEVPGVALAAISEGEGAGKNKFIDFMRQFVLGDEIVMEQQGIDKYLDKHDCSIKGRRLCVVNEMASTKEDFRSNFDKMKTMITDRRISLNPKNIQGYEIDNITGWLLNSNHRDALLVSETDRRYCAFEVSECHLQDHQYFNYIETNFFNQNVGDHVFTYLKSINATKMDVLQFPKTALKTDMIELSKPSYRKYIDSIKLDLFGDDGKIKTEHSLSPFVIEDEGKKTNKIKATALFARYQQWCKDENERHVCNQTKFSQEAMRHIKQTKPGNVSTFHLNEWLK